MEVGQLQRRWVDLTSSLFCEGFLDDHFTQLQRLQDPSNPDFVSDVIYLFFDDSEKLINGMSCGLDQQIMDFKKVGSNVHQLKGSSSSVGAPRVTNACIALRSCCEENNYEECLRCLQQLKNEFALVKTKLESLFKLEQQIVAAGGSIPMMG